MMARLVTLVALLFAASATATDLEKEFSLPGLDGRQHTLAEYQGKWVIINYWATNCAPCLKEIPELEHFYRRHKDMDAIVLGVNYEDIKMSWLKDFISSVQMTYPVLLAEPDEPTPFGPVMVLPTTVIVSPDGDLQGMHRGIVTAKLIEDFIREHGSVPAQESGAARPL